MTPLPDGLVELRKAVASSFEMRDGQWRPDPQLLERLVATEEAWGRELLRRRDFERETTPGPPPGWTAQGATERILVEAHTRPEYIEAQRRL